MNTRNWIATAGAAFVLVGCYTVPPNNPALQSARESYELARSDARVQKYAPVELSRARDALATAENEFRDSGDNVAANHLAYVARQRALIATEVGARGDADERIKTASVERDKLIADARARDIAIVHGRAIAAEQSAAVARQEAMNAQAQAELARQQSASAEDRAARLQQELISLQAKNTDRGMVVTLPDVVFDTGSATLRSGAERTLDRIADMLRSNPERRVAIEGFTDSQGSDSYNLDLSARRANSVREALVTRGVAGDRIIVRPYGEAFPVATNDSSTGRQLNRRVEIVFSDNSGALAGARTMSGEYGSSIRPPQ